MFIPAVIGGKLIRPIRAVICIWHEESWTPASVCPSHPANSCGPACASFIKVRTLHPRFHPLVNDCQEMGMWPRGNVAECEGLFAFASEAPWASRLGYSPWPCCYLDSGKIYGASGLPLPLSRPCRAATGASRKVNEVDVPFLQAERGQIALGLRLCLSLVILGCSLPQFSRL